MMLTPMLGFAAGLLAVLYAYLSYGDSPLLEVAPSFLRRKGHLLWLVGWVMIGLALMTGMAGFLLKANLGLERFLLGGGGLALLFTHRCWRTKGSGPGNTERSAVLFLVLLAVFYGSPVRTSFDSRWAIHTTVSFVRGHWGDLSDYTPILEKETLYAIEYYKGRPHNSFPIGVSLLSVPPVAAVLLIRPSFNEELRYAVPVELESVLASAYGALAGVVFFWIVFARFRSYYLALSSTFILCFCTSMWSTATRGLWQHGPLVLMFVVAMGLLVRARTRPSEIEYLSLPLAMAFIIRPTAAVEILVLSLIVLIFYRRWFVRYILWSLLLLVPWVAYNLWVFDGPLPPYYLPTESYSSGSLGEALLGNLFSPARGLFVYSPILLFALPGFALALLEREERWLHTAFGTIIVLHWLVVARFAPVWWGGYAYGPRLMTDVLPFLVYFLVFAVRPPGVGRLGCAAIAGGMAVLAGLSLLMHAQGALNGAVYAWNYDPVSVNSAPMRLWSWSDPQFARRGLVRPGHGPLLNLTGGVVPPEVKLYESGLVVRFQPDRPSFDPSVLASGWSTPEKGGVWSEGPEARLVLDPRRAEGWAGARDLLLIVRARSFVTHRHPQQLVDVLVNDTPVAGWSFDVGDATMERRAHVPAAVVAAKLPLTVTFRFRNPVTPVELGLGADNRRLGIALTDLRLVPSGDGH